MARGGADLRTPAVLALAAAIGVWPYLATLGFAPMTLDAVHWIQRAAPGADARWQWIFSSAHFVAYRPMTALSFALTGAVGGPDGIHRFFDLGLHVLGGVLVWAVARQLPALPRAGALLAAALFLLHPVAEDVVPWLARRGYSLATCFSLGALWLLARSQAAEPGDRAALRLSLASAACLLAAVLSNEVAFTAAAILPAWAWVCAPAARRSLRGALRASAPGLAAAAAAVVVRSGFVEGVGGYAADASAARFAAVYAGFWRDLIAFDPEYAGARSALQTLALGVGGAGLLGCMAYTLVAARQRREAAPLLLVLLGWLLFASLLLCAQNVWFSRELLPLVPAFALWLAATLADALAARRGWALAPLAVIGVLLLNAPALRGTDPLRMARWSETQALVDDLTHTLDAAQAPTWVGLGLGYQREQREGAVRARGERVQPPRFLRLAPLWLGPRYAERGHAIETLIALPGTRQAPAQAELIESHGTALLRVPPGQEIERFAGVPAPRSDASGAQLLALHALSVARAAPGQVALFHLRVGGAGRFVRLPGRRS